jgi:hypothetical protein
MAGAILTAMKATVIIAAAVSLAISTAQAQEIAALHPPDASVREDKPAMTDSTIEDWRLPVAVSNWMSEAQRTQWKRNLPPQQRSQSLADMPGWIRVGDRWELREIKKTIR